MFALVSHNNRHHLLFILLRALSWMFFIAGMTLTWYVFRHAPVWQRIVCLIAFYVMGGYYCGAIESLFVICWFKHMKEDE